MEYLIILLIFLLVSIFIELKYHLKLYSSRKERIIIPPIFLITGAAWDSFAVWGALDI